MSEPRVSVAMASYNGGLHIEEQLGSLASQRLLPCELVVCDDGSSDATIEVLQRFAERAPFDVKIVKNGTQLGPSSNFFKAASLCTGDLIAFCDQDDVWLPHKLRTCVARIERDASLVSLHTSTVVDQHLRRKETLRQGIDANTVLEPLNVFPWSGDGWGHTMLIRRCVLDLAAPDSRPMSPWRAGAMEHDIWIYLVGSALGRTSLINEELVLYRQHSRNDSGYTIKSPLRERLLRYFTFDTTYQTKRAAVYRRAVDLFDDISCGRGRFSEAAAVAKSSYQAMLEGVESRIAFFEANGLRERTSHFLRRLSAKEPQSAATLTKDVVVGLLGMRMRPPVP